MNKRILLFFTLFILTHIIFAQSRISRDGIKLERTLQLINNLYVDEVNAEGLTASAIRGMLEDLDPHSVYLSQEEVREMNEPLQGNFEGIGISFNMLTDTLYVMDVISGGPSQKVGIMPGDKMIYVNDSLIAGIKMGNKEIISKLRGEKGTTVNVKMKRRDVSKLLEFRIVRDKIPIYSIDASYMLDAQTGYIRLSRFGANSVKEFKSALDKLQKKGMKNLVFDLSGNGGGILQTAAKIVDEFLGNDKMIVYTEGKHQPRYNLKATQKGSFERGKLVILVDEGAASASEIVSGAVQDWDRGIIVGRRTFGKGLVQRQLPLTDGSMIRLTVARYYTPSGRCIQKPYENGNKANYYADFDRRFKHGEMMHADSIHFPDSLRYATLINQRVVYGGGGIMPDHFVPFDTTKVTPLHRSLIAKGILNKVTIDEVDNHRKQLLKKFQDVDAFKAAYQIPNTLVNKMIKLANEEKVTWKEDEFAQSKSLLYMQLKALIARDLYNMAAYFKIMNEENEIFLEGFKIISNDNLYNKILSGKIAP